MRDGSAWMTIDPPARPADPKKLREWEAAARFGASGMHKMLDPHHYPHLDSLDVVSATDLDEWLKPTGYTFSVPIAEPAPRASATEVAAAEVETEVAAGTLVPVLEQFAESELPVKKAAMIARHKGKWPTIEGDMKDANRNGLKDARTGHRGWLEKKALEWAHNRNKLPGTEKAVDELARTVNSMVDLQGQKHTMKR